MKHCLIIEKFGKIERAEIQAAPFTLFVGDNNSGKSYLLSLLWGIYSADETSVLFSNFKNLECNAYEEIYGTINNLIKNLDENQKQEIKIASVKFLEVLNIFLDKNKDRFVSEIFNSEQVTVQKLAVEIQEEFDLEIQGKKEENRINVSYNVGNTGKNRISFPVKMAEKKAQFITNMICQNILLWFLKGRKGSYTDFNVVYLPASRTGFMLAKNVINKVGRQMAYDVSDFYDTEKRTVMEPFTKPVIRFLDALEDLSLEHKTRYEEIVTWIEQEMAHGKVHYDSETANEIRYVPKGSGASFPLRTTSAVVTELTPLLLLLKYKRRLEAIFYEEPEMCLHPQLQQEMGRLLIRLVNSGISMIVTTHSDIIVQHINNMCRLRERNDAAELLEKLKLEQEDLMDIQNVAVYQFTDKGRYSAIERVTPVNGEFRVETFINALTKILEQTSEVQDFEGE